MESALRKPITWIWRQSAQLGHSRDKAPSQRVRGEAREAERQSLFDAQLRANFGPLSRISRLLGIFDIGPTATDSFP